MNVHLRPPSDGEGFLIVADELLEGVKVLSGSGIATTLPWALLCAQTLENGLKAFLWSKGIAANDMHGHNLEDLWVNAANSGLDVTRKPANWCVLLNTLHNRPYRGRYPSGLNGFVTPNVTDTVAALKRILSLVRCAMKSAPWRDPSGSNP